MMKKSPEYFRKYIKKLNYEEFVNLSTVMIELSHEMQEKFTKATKLLIKKTKKERDNGDDKSYQ